MCVLRNVYSTDRKGTREMEDGEMREGGGEGEREGVEGGLSIH